MVLSIGEILVDIFADGENKRVFPGGAPFNLACNIKKFKGDVFFYGAVGKDEYGKFLSDAISKRLSDYYLEMYKEYDTTQALVTIDNGERSFRFVRSNGADYHLNVKTLNEFDYSKIKIVHIGSLMLSAKEGQEFYYSAVKELKKHNVRISFDVNYRDDIFKSEEEAKNIFISALKEADIIKFTEEELELLSGQKDILVGLKALLTDKQVAVVTLGSKGSMFFSKNKFIQVPSFPLKPVDTTGAGDAFYSYFLYSLDKGLDISNDEEIRNALTRANIVGGLTTQKFGAIDTAPTLEEIEEFYQSHK